jgi:hypothetical protein
MSKRAILAIVPDVRQSRILARVIPSWQHYARRHDLEIITVERSITRGRHPYWDRWLTIQDGVPEVAGIEELLLLDNDIFIATNAPNIFEQCDPSKINVVEESAQAPWNRRKIPDYYRTFHVEPDCRLKDPTKVFNFGVCVLRRQNGYLFQGLHQKWLNSIRPRFTDPELKQRDIFFRLEADGPFLSYELQTQMMINTLPGEFNFFLPPWLKRTRVHRLPFLVQCKLAQKLTGKIPKSVLCMLTNHAHLTIRHVAGQCYFLHVAGSKSPLWLLPDAE